MYLSILILVWISNGGLANDIQKNGFSVRDLHSSRAYRKLTEDGFLEYSIKNFTEVATLASHIIALYDGPRVVSVHTEGKYYRAAPFEVDPNCIQFENKIIGIGDACSFADYCPGKRRRTISSDWAGLVTTEMCYQAPTNTTCVYDHCPPHSRVYEYHPVHINLFSVSIPDGQGKRMFDVVFEPAGWTWMTPSKTLTSVVLHGELLQNNATGEDVVPALTKSGEMYCAVTRLPSNTPVRPDWIDIVGNTAFDVHVMRYAEGDLDSCETQLACANLLRLEDYYLSNYPATVEFGYQELMKMYPNAKTATATASIEVGPIPYKSKFIERSALDFKTYDASHTIALWRIDLEEMARYADKHKRCKRVSDSVSNPFLSFGVGALSKVFQGVVGVIWHGCQWLMHQVMKLIELDVEIMMDIFELLIGLAIDLNKALPLIEMGITFAYLALTRTVDVYVNLALSGVVAILSRMLKSHIAAL